MLPCSPSTGGGKQYFKFTSIVFRRPARSAHDDKSVAQMLEWTWLGIYTLAEIRPPSFRFHALCSSCLMRRTALVIVLALDAS
jgi:hypothetical protein